MKVIAATLLTISFCTTANAERVAAFGIPDCGTWVNNQTQGTKLWLAGFMSGKNFAWNKTGGIDPLDGVQNFQQLILWMDNWCRGNPLKTVSDGGNELWEELLQQAAKNKR